MLVAGSAKLVEEYPNTGVGNKGFTRECSDAASEVDGSPHLELVAKDQLEKIRTRPRGPEDENVIGNRFFYRISDVFIYDIFCVSASPRVISVFGGYRLRSF